MGKTVAEVGAFSPSLKSVILSIISSAIKNKINEPATANSFTFIPIRFKISSPIKRKTIITIAAIIAARPLRIFPNFERNDIIIGILPIISITAKSTIVAVAISLKFKFTTIHLGHKIKPIVSSSEVNQQIVFRLFRIQNKMILNYLNSIVLQIVISVLEFYSFAACSNLAKQ